MILNPANQHLIITSVWWRCDNRARLIISGSWYFVKCIMVTGHLTLSLVYLFCRRTFGLKSLPFCIKCAIASGTIYRFNTLQESQYFSLSVYLSVRGTWLRSRSWFTRPSWCIVGLWIWRSGRTRMAPSKTCSLGTRWLFWVAISCWQTPARDWPSSMTPRY